jgi:hypothetical protein
MIELDGLSRPHRVCSKTIDALLSGNFGADSGLSAFGENSEKAAVQLPTPLRSFIAMRHIRQKLSF